jgi:hypothetical protein
LVKSLPPAASFSKAYKRQVAAPKKPQKSHQHLACRRRHYYTPAIFADHYHPVGKQRLSLPFACKAGGCAGLGQFAIVVQRCKGISRC